MKDKTLSKFIDEINAANGDTEKLAMICIRIYKLGSTE